MYIDVVPNRSSPPAVLLRESVRDGHKIRKVTLANLSAWPPAQVERLRRLLRGEILVPLEEAFTITRSLPPGHVGAVLGTLRQLGLEKIIDAGSSPERDGVVAMIVARILDPASKLATARGLDEQTGTSSLGHCLHLNSAREQELYEAMDWLLLRQAKIEQRLAKRHLAEGSLVLYDVTSTYFEGRCCPLAHYGYSRDERPGNLQIVFGLLTNGQGCPLAVEVFEGNLGDPKTVATQVSKLRERFGLQQVVLVGDRGMLTSARIEQDLKVAGLEWITALRSPQIQALVHSRALQLSLFDERDLAEITHPDYPGERLINPLLAAERARKRQELLAATEAKLDEVLTATRRLRRPLRGKDKIGLAVGKVLGRYKMSKHFLLEIEDHGFSCRRNQESIAREAALDGIYVIRTNVAEEKLSAADTVRQYKQLSAVERALRSWKSMDLKVRPIHHHLADRVRAHVFLCMLAYYVEWHMRQAWAPLLFADADPEAGEAQRGSVVAPAQRSPQAQEKAPSKRTEDGLPVHSFQSLLHDLATLTLNQVKVGEQELEILATPTLVQQRAFDLLHVSPRG